MEFKKDKVSTVRINSEVYEKLVNELKITPQEIIDTFIAENFKLKIEIKKIKRGTNETTTN